MFEPLWRRESIANIQITLAEDLGVGARGDYYDRSGALRDMIPNHLFQLVTLTAMEPPISFQANAVRDEQADVARDRRLVGRARVGGGRAVDAHRRGMHAGRQIFGGDGERTAEAVAIMHDQIDM